MRFIHTADLHLGAPMTGAPYRNKIRQTELKAFQSILHYAEQQQIGYIVIAGDLFDTPHPPAALLAAVKKMMVQCPARIFIAAGNHDALREGKYMDGDFPANVHIFSERAECVTVEEGSFVGGSLAMGRPHPFTSLPKTEGTAVGVFHGEVGDSNAAYRIEAAQVRDSGLVCLSLGHIHLRQEPYYIGGTYVMNCGAVVAHGFDELTEGAAYDVRIENGIVKWDKLPLDECTVRFGEMPVAVTDTMSQGEIIAALTLAAAQGEEMYDVYRFRVTGETACVIPDALEDYENLYEIIDETSLPLSLEKEAAGQSLKGYFIRGMMERLESAAPEDRPKIEAALRLGLEALE